MCTIYEKSKVDLEEMLNKLKSFPKLYIYTAGNRAKELIQMQKIGFLELQRPECFLVTRMEGNRESVENPERIDGIPVYTLHNYVKQHKDLIEETKDVAVFVPVMEHYHEEIAKALKEAQFQNVFFLTDVMERILIADCMKYYYKICGLDFQMTEMLSADGHFFAQKENTVSAMTYRVQCAKDVPLAETVEDREWVTPIQSGAILTDAKVAQVTDADGENISEKNPYYNEMTGLYWLWKNTDLDYSGICHYRRQFESDVVWKYLLSGKADAVLPMPLLVYPNLAGYYLNWGEKAYYETMLQVIAEQHSEYYETALWCTEHNIFYPNNIFIAKRKIVEDYCTFAFSVLDEVEERMQNYDGKKQTRCWLSEHVTTIYFVKHHLEYKIMFSNLRRYW